MDFKQIQDKAKAEWEATQNSKNIRILVGMGTCGIAAGADNVMKAIEEKLAKTKIKADIIPVGCNGLCYAEPLIEIIKPGKPNVLYRNVTPELMSQIIDDYLVADNPRSDLAFGARNDGALKDIPDLFELPALKPQLRITLKDCGNIDPENINHYIANGGYEGLARALKMKPQEVIDIITKSGLRGRGGAGFPTGRKWQECRDAEGDIKYVIVNADEGDPGAYMDRSLLEGNPHSVLEGLIIGAYAIGAHQGYIYVRQEYPLAVKNVNTAIEQARKYGFLGKNIMGSGFDFDVNVHRGAGAFISGESTALMTAIEGKVGEPRPKYIHTSEKGLYDRPSNLNNVETWANVPLIIKNGADWFASIGTEGSKGTKIFSLVGKVNNTGLIEVPMGITLREVIFNIGGGIPAGKKFKAVQTGGPSGGCIPEQLIDMHVDFDELSKAGSMMGSGGMIVMDEDTCMVDTARYFVNFLSGESCGKCVPCREGLKQMLDILNRVCAGKGKEGDIELLEDICSLLSDASLCALGTSAANPVMSTIKYFRDEYEAHIKDKKCPAKVCKDLVTYYIDPKKCQACMICLRACPANAISGDKKVVHVIDQKKCTKCGTCAEVCPTRFDAVVKLSGEPIPQSSKSSTK